ncbi:MAG: hypothetical protein BAJALOKI1v1_580012 [Promethearchaeota archaeon]|nr:MAG: hypothetical protein BAJALOKI1v1_580012 [Candidatus Lokiarchaeota archaeon]
MIRLFKFFLLLKVLQRILLSERRIKKTVVVLTLPRSGSSLLAGILHRLGVDMGADEQLIERKFLNKFGCYEDRDFVLFNFKVLAEAGEIGRFKNHNDKKIEYLINTKKNYIKKLIQKKESDLWGWKDPSTIYTIPFLHQFLTNPFYICLRRDIDDIVNSILKVVKSFWNLFYIINIYFRVLKLKTIFKVASNFFLEFIRKGTPLRTRAFIQSIIKSMYERIDEFLKDKNYISVTVKEIVEDPMEIIDRLSRFLDIDPSDKQISDARAFIHPEIITT